MGTGLPVRPQPRWLKKCFPTGRLAPETLFAATKPLLCSVACAVRRTIRGAPPFFCGTLCSVCGFLSRSTRAAALLGGASSAVLRADAWLARRSGGAGVRAAALLNSDQCGRPQIQQNRRGCPRQLASSKILASKQAKPFRLLASLLEQSRLIRVSHQSPTCFSAQRQQLSALRSTAKQL